MGKEQGGKSLRLPVKKEFFRYNIMQICYSSKLMNPGMIKPGEFVLTGINHPTIHVALPRQRIENATYPGNIMEKALQCLP